MVRAAIRVVVGVVECSTARRGCRLIDHGMGGGDEGLTLHLSNMR